MGLDGNWVEVDSSSEFLIVKLSTEGLNCEVSFLVFFFFFGRIGPFINIQYPLSHNLLKIFKIFFNYS